MTRPFRFLTAGNSSAAVTTSTPSSEPPATVDSDFVVILVALLCALICVLGLIAVARCAWLRRLTSSSSSASAQQNPPPSVANKGLKKKVLRSLPKQTFSPEDPAAKLSECAICLTEFAAGDEIRILPQCGHGFHVSCIDTWLGSHSSCPSCRQILVVSRCQKCGGMPAGSSGTTTSGGGGGGAESTSEARLKEREDDANRFLP